MKQVWLLLGVAALMTGCAVGSDPNGDETTGLTQAGTTPDPTTEQAPPVAQNGDKKADLVMGHTSEFSGTVQVIPGKPNRNGPIAPDPLHQPDPTPEEMQQ